MQHDGENVRASELESVTMAALRSGLSRSYLYRLIRMGKVDTYLVGGRNMLHRKDIDRLIYRRKAS